MKDWETPSGLGVSYLLPESIIEKTDSIKLVFITEKDGLVCE